MSSDKLCVVMLCVVSACSVLRGVRAVPYGQLDSSVSGLTELYSRSICESVVEYDEQEDRIPRVIKQVKCAASPDKMCPARDGSGGESSCCHQSSYLDMRFACQEVKDSVLVKDTAGVTSLKTVSVGCACVMNHRITAEEV